MTSEEKFHDDMKRFSQLYKLSYQRAIGDAIAAVKDLNLHDHYRMECDKGNDCDPVLDVIAIIEALGEQQ